MAHPNINAVEKISGLRAEISRLRGRLAELSSFDPIAARQDKITALDREIHKRQIALETLRTEIAFAYRSKARRAC